MHFVKLLLGKLMLSPASRLLWREHCQRVAANRRLSVDRDKHGALAMWAAGAPHPGVEQGEDESQAQQADDRHQVRRRHHRQRLVVYHAEQAEIKISYKLNTDGRMQ